jgi:hypothetical protein
MASVFTMSSGVTRPAAISASSCSADHGPSWPLTRLQYHR